MKLPKNGMNLVQIVLDRDGETLRFEGPGRGGFINGAGYFWANKDSNTKKIANYLAEARRSYGEDVDIVIVEQDEWLAFGKGTCRLKKSEKTGEIEYKEISNKAGRPKTTSTPAKRAKKVDPRVAKLSNMRQETLMVTDPASGFESLWAGENIRMNAVGGCWSPKTASM